MGNDNKPQRDFVIGTDAEGNETVTFRTSDLITYGVQGYGSDEFLAMITGYGLGIHFNMRLINSIADAEKMANGMADIFFKTLMDQLIELNKDFVKHPEKGQAIL
jgi:hypothetical protein